MKALFRLLLVTIFFVALYITTDDRPNENDLLTGPNDEALIVPKEQHEQVNVTAMPRPATGISTYIGQPSNQVSEKYGLPNRIDQTKYGFEWWVYSQDHALLMFGIRDQKVVQVYTNAPQYTTGPYTIGQQLEDIYRMTVIADEISVNLSDNIYMFMMTPEDRETRLLLGFDGVYAQLYISNITNRIVGIRYLDGRTLVAQQPYEMQYVGELPEPEPVSSIKQNMMNKSFAKQLTDLTNNFRLQYDLSPLRSSATLAYLAHAHSEDMFLEKFVSHNSPNYGNLKQRLKSEEYVYQAAGENVATGYYDAIEVVHGWLNSDQHRNELLSDQYTHIGSGAFIDYYTQIFTKVAQ